MLNKIWSIFSSKSGNKEDKKRVEKALENFDSNYYDNFTLSKVLQNDIPHNLIVDLSYYLGEKCDFGKNLDVLNHAEQVIYLCETFASEVYNGGLAYFYLESCGDNCNETFIAIKEIGASKIYSLIEKANKLLGNKFPKDQDERNDLLMDIISDEVDEKLSKIETSIYDILDSEETSYYDLIYKYYLEHKDDIK